MSDLTDRIVRKLAENQLRRYESEYQADHLTWRDFTESAAEDAATAFRVLKEHLGPRRDGTLRAYGAMQMGGLADEIEAS